MNIFKCLIIIMITVTTLSGCSSTKKNTTAVTLPGESNTSLTETYWKLIELQGEPITTKEGQKKEMHLIIKKDGNIINGHSGCNSFRGTYTLNEGNRLSFSQLAGTLMACINMEKETAFMEVLRTVDNYAIQGKILSLNKARMAPLAKFEAVYLK